MINTLDDQKKKIENLEIQLTGLTIGTNQSDVWTDYLVNKHKTDNENLITKLSSEINELKEK